jgi:hypothetical protein
VIDCMTCLTQLACGCPASGRIRGANGVTHAAVTICGTAFKGTRRVPAHGFRWSAMAGRWMFFVGVESFWAARDLL